MAERMETRYDRVYASGEPAGGADPRLGDSMGREQGMVNYVVEQLDDLAAVACPCGLTRRAFVEPGASPASVHLVDISADSRTHYHKKLTEIYVVLEGRGEMELDGETVPIKPMTSVLILPECRHRAVGKLKVIVVAMPAFDPADEWFDD